MNKKFRVKITGYIDVLLDENNNPVDPELQYMVGSVRWGNKTIKQRAEDMAEELIIRDFDANIDGYDLTAEEITDDKR